MVQANRQSGGGIGARRLAWGGERVKVREKGGVVYVRVERTGLKRMG